MSVLLSKHLPDKAEAITETGRAVLVDMMNRAGAVTPSLLAIDLTEMEWRGCDCMLDGTGGIDVAREAIADALTARLQHHVDFAHGTSAWNASAARAPDWLGKRAEIEAWCFENMRGAFNDFRTCQRNENSVAIRRVWRWAFADPNEAFLFRVRWQ